MCLLQAAVCKQPSAFTRETYTRSKSITFLGIHKSRLDSVGRTRAYQQLQLFLFLKYSLDEIFQGTEYCTRNWLQICSQNTKKVALSTKWKDHIRMISQKWKTHFVFFPQPFLAMEDKYILSHLSTKIYFGSPIRGKFSFGSS